LIVTPSNVPAASPEPPQLDVSFASEEAESGGGFTILQLWLMVRAHLWLSMGLFVLLLALAFVAIKKLPKSYTATATLIVDMDKTDPLAGRNYSAAQSNTFFPTQMELIYNSVMLMPVVDRLQLQKDSNFTRGFTGDPKTLNDVVLENLRGALGVKQGTGSQMLYISGSARNPQQSADIANAVADEYLKQSRQRINAPAKELADRYNAQVEELRKKAELAQAKVTEFREKTGMADLKDGQVGDAEGYALQDLESKLRESENSRRQLEARLGATGLEGASSDGAEVVALRGKLAEVENQLTAASTRFGSQHPEIRKLRAERDSTLAALQSSAATALSRAKELEATYKAAASAEKARLLNRRIQSDEGTKLLMELQLANENYSKALGGVDQVQFASAGNYKDVTLVSAAEPPIKASKPNKMKMFLAALVASLGIALGGPFAYELLLDRRIRSRDDLERSFRIITLAQFDRVAPPRLA
jgi:succinoglycan biosynthesis transport protein ExoP